MHKEPLVTVASITAAVTAVLALLAAFGLPFTDTQQSAILGLVAVAAPLVVAAFARSRVTPYPAPAAPEHREGGWGQIGVLLAVLIVVVIVVAALRYL